MPDCPIEIDPFQNNIFFESVKDNSHDYINDNLLDNSSYVIQNLVKNSVPITDNPGTANTLKTNQSGLCAKI